MVCDSEYVNQMNEPFCPSWLWSWCYVIAVVILRQLSLLSHRNFGSAYNYDLILPMGKLRHKIMK